MSKPVVVNIPHELGRTEARRRLEGGFGRIREQIGSKGLHFEERWEDERLHFSARTLGQTVSGQIDILDNSVRVEVNLPWILSSIAQKLQGRLRKEGALLLEKK